MFTATMVGAYSFMLLAIAIANKIVWLVAIDGGCFYGY